MTNFYILCLLLLVLASAYPLRVLLANRPGTADGDANHPKQWRLRQAAGFFIVLLCSAGFLYTYLGNIPAITQARSDKDLKARQQKVGIGEKQILAMVEGLAARLKKQPDDAEGWRRLARSYETLRRFDLAVNAYQQLLRLRPDDADVLTDYAVSLAVSRQQNLSGEPEQLLKKALSIKPGHIQALALLGSAAYERQDYQAAVLAWKKIVAQLPADDEMAVSINASISKAEKLAAQKK
ncbi:tetratricopeptide repeat protein [Undibacterium pigrum]|uniref:Cytochrome c-type biogenesis protein CcmH/NrfG n=1 Tax=Undibacterium pigrum TaxID=401470 RepID=A0A318JJY2_9BURK|nr:tetratricopeptide repeat protein [Undibacterium pigrum]PXX44064.1 cytochrome c-type biogenesis protein CcmH/NrfG [Undibacterium pigrum]